MWFLPVFFPSVLKDVPFIPSEVYTHRLRDNVRLSMFPSLNYSGLYEGVLNIIDVVPLVQHGQHGEYMYLHTHTHTIFKNNF